MNAQEFSINRARFPRGELQQYRSKWVAFSPDGRRIVASSSGLDELEDRLAEVGEDPQQVVFERIPGPEDDMVLGGGETGRMFAIFRCPISRG